MHIAEANQREFYLQPGELCFVRGPYLLKTVLGSCVGITFRTPRLGVSAMCHPMLPNLTARSRARHNPMGARRYVDYVIAEAARKFDRLGASREEIEVKLFGGADVLTPVRNGATVGAMNAQVALSVLEEERFTVLASRLGGSRGIFIEFNTGTGEVLVRQLAQMDPHVLART